MDEDLYKPLLKFAKLPTANQTLLNVPVYYRNQNREVLSVVFMGQIIFYTYNKYVEDSLLSTIYLSNIKAKQLENYITDRPFAVNRNYYFKLGKSYALTDEKDHNLPNYPFTFNIENNFIRSYKEEFCDYLDERFSYWSRKMEFDRTNWKFKPVTMESAWTALDIEQKIIRIDIRLFAYNSEIIDSVIVGVIAVLKNNIFNKKIRNSEILYETVMEFSPHYEKHFDYIRKGVFEGDDYGIDSLKTSEKIIPTSDTIAKIK